MLIIKVYQSPSSNDFPSPPVKSISRVDCMNFRTIQCEIALPCNIDSGCLIPTVSKLPVNLWWSTSLYRWTQLFLKKIWDNKEVKRIMLFISLSMIAEMYLYLLSVSLTQRKCTHWAIVYNCCNNSLVLLSNIFRGLLHGLLWWWMMLAV